MLCTFFSRSYKLITVYSKVWHWRVFRDQLFCLPFFVSITLVWMKMKMALVKSLDIPWLTWLCRDCFLIYVAFCSVWFAHVRCCTSTRRQLSVIPACVCLLRVAVESTGTFTFLFNKSSRLLKFTFFANGFLKVFFLLFNFFLRPTIFLRCWSMDLMCTEKISQDNCYAMRDLNVLEDERVLRDLLDLEQIYVPPCDYFKEVQSDVEPFMRKIVTKWMLEVRKK